VLHWQPTGDGTALKSMDCPEFILMAVNRAPEILNGCCCAATDTVASATRISVSGMILQRIAPDHLLEKLYRAKRAGRKALPKGSMRTELRQEARGTR
jgi:hypothetical protein